MRTRSPGAWLVESETGEEDREGKTEPSPAPPCSLLLISLRFGREAVGW